MIIYYFALGAIILGKEEKKVLQSFVLIAKAPIGIDQERKYLNN